MIYYSKSTNRRSLMTTVFIGSFCLLFFPSMTKTKFLFVHGWGLIAKRQQQQQMLRYQRPSDIESPSSSPRMLMTRLYSSSSSSSSSSNDENNVLVEEKTTKIVINHKKEKRYAAAKEKRRRKFIGLAKAVDRGQFTCYNPGGDDGLSFKALSGLPDCLSSSSSKKTFTVLGIESSCDDTGAAIVRSDGVILGEALASQSHIHEEWGGVVPGLAKNAHEENIDFVIQSALENAGNLSISDDIDAIGVTVGPGLEICLRVGSNKAKQIAIDHSKPFVGIHHLEAHVLMARLEQPNLQFPFLALLVSGGHCQIMKCLGVGQYSIIGGTLDDSLGEAYDKTARLLGLPVGGGGGPAIEKLAKEYGNSTAIPLTIPLQHRKDCDFSYAGLKTNVRRAAEKLTLQHGLETPDQLPIKEKADIAASFQNIAIKHLEQRLKRAMDGIEKQEETQEEEEDSNGTNQTQTQKIRTLAVVGGVAANQELRMRLNELCTKRQWDMVVPPPRLCTDQGAMSAWAAIERLKLGSSDEPSTQEVYARYPFAYKKKQQPDNNM